MRIINSTVKGKIDLKKMSRLKAGDKNYNDLKNNDTLKLQDIYLGENNQGMPVSYVETTDGVVYAGSSAGIYDVLEMILESGEFEPGMEIQITEHKGKNGKYLDATIV